jgi:hypothetical protein
VPLVLRRLVCLIAVLAGLVLAPAAVGAKPRLPVIPTGQDATGQFLKVRPPSLFYTGDATGAIAGAHIRGRNSAIRWTSWTPDAARGDGYDQLNDCRPDCARGKYHGYPAKIVAWRPRRLHGVLVFTRLTLFYLRSIPYGKFRHYTFTDEFEHGGFGFDPPDAKDYCSHRDGLAPDPGCRNIHSLPHMTKR